VTAQRCVQLLVPLRIVHACVTAALQWESGVALVLLVAAAIAQ
jgi:hypothetical protein